MTEDEKNNTALSLMELIEHIDAAISLTKSLETLPFESVSRDRWQAIQDAMDPLRQILEIQKASISLGGKLLDNDALYAHLRTVVEAP